MGDRTYGSVETSLEYEDTVERVFGCEPTDRIQDGNAVWMQWDEINWGEWSKHKELASEGIPHIIQWGAGSSYSPGAVCFDGKKTYSVEMLDGQVVVGLYYTDGRVDPLFFTDFYTDFYTDDGVDPLFFTDFDGEVNPLELQNARDYLKISQSLQKKWGKESPVLR